MVNIENNLFAALLPLNFYFFFFFKGFWFQILDALNCFPTCMLAETSALTVFKITLLLPSMVVPYSKQSVDLEHHIPPYNSNRLEV